MAADKAKAQRAILAKRTLARRRLIHFTKYTKPGYRDGWVHHDIAWRLERFSQQIVNEESPRLLLLVPPRHGKSELASIRFPAYHLGVRPDHQFINTGYNLDLPNTFSRGVRNIIRSPGYQALFPETQLDPETRSVEHWKTTLNGGLTTAGVGGGVTGKGAHCLTIDDPIKNQMEADSPRVRDQLWDWYMSTAYTRLEPGGGVLVIQTHWNDDDLAGRLQAMMREHPEGENELTGEIIDHFEVIKYPALAEEYEYRNERTMVIMPRQQRDPALQAQEEVELLREPGDPLHPARYPKQALMRIKGTLDRRMWSALYQQNPIPDEGLYFKREDFRYMPVMPQPYGLNVYTAWDFAIGEKEENDWTVATTILHDDRNRMFVLEVRRFQGGTHEIAQVFVEQVQRWGTLDHTGYAAGVEHGQLWMALEPTIRQALDEAGLYPHIEPLKPLTDKLVRARPLQGRMQAGKFWWPNEAPWLGQARRELLRFPGGEHDDIVDSLAWAVRLAMESPPPKRSASQQQQSWRDRLTSALRSNDRGTHMAS